MYNDRKRLRNKIKIKMGFLASTNFRSCSHATLYTPEVNMRANPVANAFLAPGETGLFPV